MTLRYPSVLVTKGVFFMLKICLISCNNLIEVKATLSSISNIDFEYEILIVDSSSNLDIFNFSQNLQISSVVYIWEQKRGIYHAMNTAWRACKSQDLIWYLNPGDKLISVEVLKNLISGIELQNYDWGFGQALLANSNSPAFPKVSTALTPEALHQGTLSISHQAILIKQHKLNELGGFQDQFVIAADLDLEFKLLKSIPAYFEKAPMVVVDGSGLSNQKVLKTIYESAIVRKNNGILSLNGAVIWYLLKIGKKVVLSLRRLAV
jgi:glycosyltransferase involved in cell wall biosynthesis